MSDLNCLVTVDNTEYEHSNLAFILPNQPYIEYGDAKVNIEPCHADGCDLWIDGGSEIEVKGYNRRYKCR